MDPEDSKNVTFIEMDWSSNSSAKSAGMPGCYGVKFLLQSIWLKIEIWDLQGMYIDGMNLVFLDPDNPHHKFVKTCRERWLCYDLGQGRGIPNFKVEGSAPPEARSFTRARVITLVMRGCLSLQNGKGRKTGGRKQIQHEWKRGGIVESSSMSTPRRIPMRHWSARRLLPLNFRCFHLDVKPKPPKTPYTLIRRSNPYGVRFVLFLCLVGFQSTAKRREKIFPIFCHSSFTTHLYHYWTIDTHSSWSHRLFP